MVVVLCLVALEEQRGGGGDSYLMMPVDISQWPATIGCVLVPIQIFGHSRLFLLSSSFSGFVVVLLQCLSLFYPWH